MNIFEKIGETASKTYKATANKTSKIAKEAKLKILINDDEDKINELYKDIGQKMYESYSSKNEVDETSLKDIFTKIDALNQEIKDTKTELLKLKDSKVCKNCGEKIDLMAKYCNNCGYEQEDGAEENKDE